MLDNLILGLTAAVQLKQFLFMVAGTVIGLWVGVLPGLGGPVAGAHGDGHEKCCRGRHALRDLAALNARPD